MDTNKEKQSKDFIRGGQIFQHNMRMWSQITTKVLLYGALIFVILNLIWVLARTTAYERYVVLHWLEAKFWLIFDVNHVQMFIQPAGNSYNVLSKDIVSSPIIQGMLRQLSSTLITGLIITGVIQVFVYFGIVGWLKRSGREKTHDQRKAGDHFVECKALSDIIRNKRIASDLRLGNVPLIENKECQHMMFDGTTGSGKSTAIAELLDQIRARGDRAIIYDKGCSFIQKFFDDGDVLMNPLDVRGAKWHLWHECRDSVDYDNLAVALIPKSVSGSDPFWVDAARSVFSATAFGMRKSKDKNAIQLLKYLLTTELEKIKNLLEGTFAETLTSDKIEKTAISIRAMLATYLKCLKYVDDDPNGFSIRNWIQDDTKSNWLFITSLGDRHATLKPLMTAWLDIAINALLSLTASDTRRVWFILDEMSSLQALPSLESGLSESRKFGGCFVLGWQNISQLRRVYGLDGARSLSSLANTRLIYRQPDPDIARWSASNLGECIMDEVREGISYGANSMRDGVSISRVEMRKPVVSYSEIMNLDDLNCYLRLPGSLPLSKLQFRYVRRKQKEEPFLLRELNEDAELEEAIERYENPSLLKNDDGSKESQDVQQSSLKDKGENLSNKTAGEIAIEQLN